MSGSALARGRALYEQRAWAECRALLQEAERDSPLEPEDLRLLSISCYLAGHDAESEEALARCFRAYAERKAWPDAARAAFWLGFMLVNGGETARGSGWLERCRGLVEEHRLTGAVAGLLDAVRAHQLAEAGAFEEAIEVAGAGATLGRREGDLDLWALHRLTVGHSLMGLGRSHEALPVLDEIMLAASDGDLSPPVTGMAYCGVIASCLDLRDLDRARQWTAALSTWCSSETDAVPYRGFCLVHRAQIMAMGGAWDDAFEEARTACDVLREPAVGLAWYALGELHRLRGDFDEAETAYRRANACGQQPEPGLARMRLAQGRTDVAVATLRRLYVEPQRTDRADVLAAYVDVMVAAGEPEAAGEAAEELTALAETHGAPLLTAAAEEATATVLCARGEGVAALPLLRRAWRGWRGLGLPYDAARVRVRIGDCCRAAGDESSAEMEYDAARLVFEQLGARPDLARLAERTSADPSGLTAREVEVLRLVAAGHSNRVVADRLFLSEKTVARHLSNIYAKLGIGSRAAATAYAYDHRLL